MFKFHIWKIFPIIFILLTNCALQQNLSLMDKSTFNKLWLKQQIIISNLIDFKIRGTIILKDLKHHNKYYGKLFFQQKNHNIYHLLLTNLFGFTELDIYIENNKNKIIDRHGNKYINTNPILTINKLTGILLPINNISNWIKGLPTNASSFTLNNKALVKTIKYKKFNKLNINYLAYTIKEKIKLPNTIQINYDNNIITLKLYEWILN